MKGRESEKGGKRDRRIRKEEKKRRRERRKTVSKGSRERGREIDQGRGYYVCLYLLLPVMEDDRQFKHVVTIFHDSREHLPAHLKLLVTNLHYIQGIVSS